MKRLPRYQKGASAISMIIIIAVLGYGGYVGIQYVPQVIESKSIDAILNNIQATQKTEPAKTEQEAKTRVIKLLQINEMDDMTKSFSVKERSGEITVTFSYERELDLIYENKKIEYVRSVVLK